MSVETYEGPPPADIERADEAKEHHEYRAMVAWFRTSLTVMGAAAITTRVGELHRGAYALSHEQPLLAFIEWYGYAELLRALEKAIESPAHVLGDLEGD